MERTLRAVKSADELCTDEPFQPSQEERAVYTVREVAHLLSLSLGGTYELVRAGAIPAERLGRRWVVPRGRFHAWLDGQRQASGI
jgi:excisionase family DNA binding protein